MSNATHIDSSACAENNQRRASNDRLRIVRLLILVFCSRLLFAFVIWEASGTNGFFSTDTRGYVEASGSLLHGSFSRHELPEFRRTPGYPLALVPAVGLGHLVPIALLENLLLATASAWLISRIATDLCPGSKAAFWAVVLYCCEPVGFLYTEKILTETLFCTQLLLFVWCLVGFFRKPTYARLLLSALALGCATFTRPVSLYLGLWLVPLFFFFPRSLPMGQRAYRAVLFPVIFALALAPWIIRNATVAGYTGFSSVSVYNLYFYSAAGVEAKLEHKSFSQMQEEMGYGNESRYLEIHPEQQAWSRGQIYRSMSVEAQRIIVQHLLSYFLIHIKGCAVVLAHPGATDLLQTVRLYPESGGLPSRTADVGVFQGMLWFIRQSPVVAPVVLLLETLLIFYYSLGLAGLRRLPFEISAFFASLAVYFILVSGGPIATARYRMPFMPLICISAGVAIAAGRKSARGQSLSIGRNCP